MDGWMDVCLFSIIFYAYEDVTVSDSNLVLRQAFFLKDGSQPGVTKTRNGKRNGMENGMKRKTEWKFRRKTKYMNFVDTTAYKGKLFEIKQNLDF